MLNRRQFLALGSVSVAHAALGSPFEKLSTSSATHTLRIEPVSLELAAGVFIKTTGYNGQAPGPLLRLREGAPVTIDVHNKTDVPELVHWHGLRIDSLNDGAMEEGSPMIPTGGHLRYTFTPEPSGSRWYHTHASAAADLARSTYSGQYGFLYIEPKQEPGNYDQEIFLAIHHWEPSFMRMGPPVNAKEVMYQYASFNDRLFSAAEPIRVQQGERVLFHFLNASATQEVTLFLPGHQFFVTALDGNPVPEPRAVDTLVLGVAERIDAIIEMDSPGVWILGSTSEEERQKGLARTIEYADRKGKALWRSPEKIDWDYLSFGLESPAPNPDIRIPMTFAASPADNDGLQRWTINGQSYPKIKPLSLQKGKRHRLAFMNSSGEAHPLHLHRHSFELVSIGDRRSSGIMKDVVNIPAYSTMEVDFIADNPGKTLFHCHQQLHMDYGFMQLFDYL